MTCRLLSRLYVALSFCYCCPLHPHCHSSALFQNFQAALDLFAVEIRRRKKSKGHNEQDRQSAFNIWWLITGGGSASSRLLQPDIKNYFEGCISLSCHCWKISLWVKNVGKLWENTGIFSWCLAELCVLDQMTVEPCGCFLRAQFLIK